MIIPHQAKPSPPTMIHHHDLPIPSRFPFDFGMMFRAFNPRMRATSDPIPMSQTMENTIPHFKSVSTFSYDKRRLKIHKLLKNYGTWVQYSVFECNLQPRDFLRLRHRLKKLLGSETDDSIRFYGLCAECARKIERIGGITPEEKTTVIV